MKINVYSENVEVSNIQGYFEGKDVLEQARDFARSMSRIAPLTLETEKFKEFYEKGSVIKTVEEKAHASNTREETCVP